MQTILLTNDAANRQKAKDEGLMAMGILQYAKWRTTAAKGPVSEGTAGCHCLIAHGRQSHPFQ